MAKNILGQVIFLICFGLKKISQHSLSFGLWQALYQLTVVFLILFYGEKMFDIDSGRITGDCAKKLVHYKFLTFSVLRFRR